MERIIRKITQQLVSLLPEDQQYYQLEELHSQGIPVFIVRRIQVELERNLAESMVLPKTDWANLQSQAVQTVWGQFVKAIREAAHLPASYAHTVIETAVADVVEMLVQPQKNLPEVIFGTNRELIYDQLVQRMDAVVVYRHFSELIPRYMQKKGLEKLSRERCAQIIANADERLTAHYSPLNWAQMLEPLFHLMDEQIDTNLLRLFFEDKKMLRAARQFDMLNTAVTRAQLIEMLSSPDSLNFEGIEDEQSGLFKPENVRNTVPSKLERPARAGEQVIGGSPEQETVLAEPEVSKEIFSEKKTDEQDITPGKNGNADSGKRVEEREAETPMWKRFMSPEEIARLEEEEASLDDDYLNKPVIGLAAGSETSDLKAKSLESMLKDDRDFFIRAIFGGSDRAYDDTLEETAAKDDWQSASKYIEKKVFKRNMVDMYSEAAVYFIDHLQTYFSVHKNRNQ